MTIVPGMIGPDYLMLAADTQERWGDMKQSVRKLHRMRVDCSINGKRQGGVVVVGGAGASSYVLHIRQRIFAAFERIYTETYATNFSKFEEAMASILRDWYETDFAIHLKADQNAEWHSRPEFVIAAALNGTRGLWETMRSSVTPIQELISALPLAAGPNGQRMFYGA